MSSELKSRLQTAILLVPLVLLCVYWGGSFFMFLLIAVGTLGIFELWQLSVKSGDLGFAPIVHTLTLGMVLCALVEKTGLLALLLALSFFCVGLLFAVVVCLWERKPFWPLLGFPLVIIPVASLLILREAPLGMQAVVWLLVTVGACDSGAYFAGRFFKGPKLAPRVSPQKTWSGLVGGLMAAVLVGVGMALVFSHPKPLVFISASLLLGALSQIGDLAQSSLKRWRGVKDTGWILPGHGGILDRSDGLVFSLLVLSPLILWSPHMAARNVLFLP